MVPKHSVASQTAMIARRHAYKAAAALGLVLILLAGRPFESGNPAAAARAARPPNFLVILVDDQAKNSFSRRYMPRTFRSIVDRGTTFSNGLAAPPLCCPDRAGILTGQYPHNHGVFSNRPGYPALKDPANTLPVWLRRAGYRTGLIGEFLIRYPKIADVQVVGVPDTFFGEELLAVIIPKAGEPLSEQELRAYCKGQISHQKIPRYFQFVASYPMTGSGKVQKFLLRENAIKAWQGR